MSSSENRHLLVSSGNGPHECRRAVSLVLTRIERGAAERGVRFHAEFSGASAKDAVASSALVTLNGNEVEEMLRRWIGTVQWTCQSPFRPLHKRRNWFVGIFAIERLNFEQINPSPQELKVEKFRSGGPGGQHQNMTDSGVRITHLPTGITAISTDERSQHRNRKMALDRLVAKLILRQQEARVAHQSAQNQLHKQLERGNPVRVFKGERFAEVR